MVIPVTRTKPGVYTKWVPLIVPSGMTRVACWLYGPTVVEQRGEVRELQRTDLEAPRNIDTLCGTSSYAQKKIGVTDVSTEMCA